MKDRVSFRGSARGVLGMYKDGTPYVLSPALYMEKTKCVAHPLHEGNDKMSPETFGGHMHMGELI